MKTSLRYLLTIATVFGMAGCAGESRESDEGTGEMAAAEPTGEHARPAGAAEPNESGEGGEHAMREGGEHSSGEHSMSGEHGEEGGEGEGEESGVYVAKTATWDTTRNGMRLVLAYNTERDAFVGTVENTTQQRICAVRVEVHLSRHVELGPTDRMDLPAGQRQPVELSAGGEAFENWTAHPELSSCDNE